MFLFFFQAEDGIRDVAVTGVQTCALPIFITRLSVVRGIGQWTAEMFLIFQLRRLDVWPVGDYGIRKGYALAYDLRKLPTPQQLEGEGERFRPYRTVAAWYCWQAVREQRKLRQ